MYVDVDVGVYDVGVIVYVGAGVCVSLYNVC